MAQKCKNYRLFVIPLKHLVSVMALVNHLRNPKQWAIAHDNGPKTQKWRVFGHASQTCSKCHGPCKSPKTPKQWAIAHKNGHKRKNDEFLVMRVKHVLSVMGLENHPGNPKLWTIAQENGPKT
jgi:hypothetical protein